MDEVRLVCEGVPGGRDVRWLNLVLSDLADRWEVAGHVRVVPAGSKVGLLGTLHGMREALGTSRVYAIRDRDFLPSELLAKRRTAEMHVLERHCVESYLVEPALLDEVLGMRDGERTLGVIADRRLWLDVGRAVLEDIAFAMRSARPSMDRNPPPTSKDELTGALEAAVAEFARELPGKIEGVATRVECVEQDMRSCPLWTRVDGKELLAELERELVTRRVLRGGNLEAWLFGWCAEHGAPRPLVVEIESALRRLLTPPAPSPGG
jgi:hypothetical protein